jgi:uncharacterized membrane protein YcaP (DUF421 family)
MMDFVLRGSVIYFAVWLLIRFSGRRTLAELTTFDFVLLLIIAEATQQALLGDDFSLTNALLVVLTLITINIALALLQRRWPPIGKLFNGVPMVIVENGRPLRELMERARVEEEDVLEAARRLQGLERMDQIKYAVLEKSGGISIIPKGS